MKEYFRKWTAIKSRLNDIPKPPFFSEREVWFCYLGANIGSEENGTGMQFLRPVIIVKKFNRELFWGIPLTRTQKDGDYYFCFLFDGLENSFAMLSQIRVMDSRRLSYKAGFMAIHDFGDLSQKLKTLLP